MDRQAEFAEKLARVRAFMAQAGLDGVALASWANFAWITAGGDNHVVMGSEGGVARILVTRDAARCGTNNIEADRILTEELAGLPIEMHHEPWHIEDPAALVARHCPGTVAGDDGEHAGGRDGWALARGRR